MNDFILEGLQMRDLKHRNVMELYGICWTDDPSHPNHFSPLIILPYMELGDLKTYLRKCRRLQRSGSNEGLDQVTVYVIPFTIDPHQYSLKIDERFACTIGQIFMSDCQGNELYIEQRSSPSRFGSKKLHVDKKQQSPFFYLYSAILG